jgi:hypothetical protein
VRNLRKIEAGLESERRNLPERARGASRDEGTDLGELEYLERMGIHFAPRSTTTAERDLIDLRAQFRIPVRHAESTGGSRSRPSRFI